MSVWGGNMSWESEVGRVGMERVLMGRGAGVGDLGMWGLVYWGGDGAAGYGGSGTVGRFLGTAGGDEVA